MDPHLENLSDTACCHTTVTSVNSLEFKPMTSADIVRVAPLLPYNASRTCDFTIGGIFMWIDYFRYSCCIVSDTLFIMGVTENDVTHTAFSLPLGSMPLSESIGMLKDYCRSRDIPLILSAVPEDRIGELAALGATETERLDDWADYLYEAESLATYAGKKLAKKRNHFNRFTIDNPGYTFEPISDSNRRAVSAFFERQHLAAGKSVSADFERLQVLDVLHHPEIYRFEGAVLSTAAEGVVAFTMGEVVGDTLYVHIEKMDHEIAGAGETVSRLFAAMMMARYPQIRYINREEDTGDEGLRKSKLAYQPVAMLHKYNVRFS